MSERCRESRNERRSAFRSSFADAFAVTASLIGLDHPDGFCRALASARPVPGGRGENFLIEDPQGTDPIRIRPLRHGGILAPLLGDRFLGPGRVEGEFALWQTLVDAGAPVPPVAFAISRHHGLFWHSFLGSAEQAGAVSVEAWLAQAPRSRGELECLARCAARSIRRFHDAGAFHGDLHSGNLLLLDPTRPVSDRSRVLLIDLDRAKRRPPLSPRDRMRDLMRLLRSLEKRGPVSTRTPRIQALFLDAYCQGERDLRHALLRQSPLESLRLRLHRLGWKLARASRTGAIVLAALCASVVALGCVGQEEAPSEGAVETRFSLLATGDTGSHRRFPNLFEGQRSVSQAMEAEDRKRPVDAIVLLGDNFYWYGLDRKSLVDRIIVNLVEPYCRFLDLSGPRSREVEPSCAAAPRDRHPVPFYAVLGNHDIELEESASLQRHAIPDFVPQWTMSPDLATRYRVAEGLDLILFESELAIDEPLVMKAALREALAGSEGPWRIVATHRPIATDEEGGLPLGGYPIWVREAIAESGRPVQLVLAGHHHSLQVFALDEPTRLVQIGVGSGSRVDEPLASDPPGSLFGRLSLGFARVDLVGDSSGQRGERLAVSLFDAPRWPFLSRFRPHRRLARFEIDLEGEATPSER